MRHQGYNLAWTGAGNHFNPPPILSAKQDRCALTFGVTGEFWGLTHPSLSFSKFEQLKCSRRNIFAATPLPYRTMLAILGVFFLKPRKYLACYYHFLGCMSNKKEAEYCFCLFHDFPLLISIYLICRAPSKTRSIRSFN